MESWDDNKRKFVKTPEEIKDFLNEINTICEKYNLSISHEDGHGAFIIEKYDEQNIKWLNQATISLDK